MRERSERKLVVLILLAPGEEEVILCPRCGGKITVSSPAPLGGYRVEAACPHVESWGIDYYDAAGEPAARIKFSPAE